MTPVLPDLWHAPPEVVRRTAFADPGFWTGYQDERILRLQSPALVPDPLARLPLGDGYALEVVLTPMLRMVDLQLVDPGRTEPHRLGNDFVNRLSTRVLRWAEVELVGRLLAAADPNWPHPGPAVLLLARFAPVLDDADADRAAGLLAAAGDAVGLPAADWVAGLDDRGFGAGWQQRGVGWAFQQSTEASLAAYHQGVDNLGLLYSQRAGDNTDFPHAELSTAFRAAVATYRIGVPADWRTQTVVALAAAAVADLSLAPVLADALDDAGSDRPHLTAALRWGDPAQAGWVAEWVLGRLPAGYDPFPQDEGDG